MKENCKKQKQKKNKQRQKEARRREATVKGREVNDCAFVHFKIVFFEKLGLFWNQSYCQIKPMLT